MSSLPRPSKTCTSPGCREQTKLGTSNCDAHHAARLALLHHSQSPHERQRKYGGAWRTTRQRILTRDGNACVYCYDTGSTHPLEVHHLTKSTNSQDHELVTLCYRHHRAIEAEVKRGVVGKVGQRIREWVAR